MKATDRKSKRVPEKPASNPAAKHPADARGNKSKLSKNRQMLGVGEDHETPEMERAHRGTFP